MPSFQGTVLLTHKKNKTKGSQKTSLWTSPEKCPDQISLYCILTGSKQTHRKQRNRLPVKRVSLFPSPKASLTVETAIALPIFLFFCIQLLTLMNLIHLHSCIQAALHQTVSELSVKAYAVEQLEEVELFPGVPGSMLGTVYIKQKIIEKAGKEYLDRSMIKGGSSGLSLVGSRIMTDAQKTIDVTVTYHVRPAVAFLGFSEFIMANRCKMKTWTGYYAEEVYGGDITKEEIVYITETGNVFHRSRMCSHLQLTIEKAYTGELESLRNENGGKYYACEVCHADLNTKFVYIAVQGDRYHNDLNCSGLKRTVLAVPVSEVGGRRECSRCGGMY